jgi:hypothetical protein
MGTAQRNTIIFIICLVGACITAGVIVALTPGHFKKDSGVTACKTISENMAKKKTGSDKPMTEAEYKRLREPFENSSHADIKVAGLNILDTIYQADTQPDPKNIGGALILMGTLQGQWGQLQTACSNQGVDVPQLPMGS